MIEIIDLSKSYVCKILDKVSFSVKNGEIVGLLGPNGAGKTTLMHIVNGVIPADSGIIKIDGVSDCQERKKYLGFAPEDDYYYENLTCFEYLSFLSNIRFGSIAGNILELIDYYGLAEQKNKLIKNYSLGMKRKLTLCQAFLNKPQNIILDDPTNALDPKGIYQTKEYLRKLREKGHAVLVTSHILDFVVDLCDRVILLRNNVTLEIDDLKDLEKQFMSFYD